MDGEAMGTLGCRIVSVYSEIDGSPEKGEYTIATICILSSEDRSVNLKFLLDPVEPKFHHTLAKFPWCSQCIPPHSG